MTAQTIISEIDTYMQGHGGTNQQWYVGIASDVNQRLFTDHNVNKNGVWIYRGATSSAAARAIEKAYHDVGCDGAGGGGDTSTTIVYAYLKTLTTDP